MEDKIEVGEYGRTNKGKIFIFAWLENLDGKRYTNKVLLGNGKIFENKFYYFDDGEEIVKHSKQLIDLIEVGDIVKDKYNKYEVAFVKEDKIYCNDYNLDDSLITLREQDIKKILAREQFEANCYKVGGEDDETSND